MSTDETLAAPERTSRHRPRYRGATCNQAVGAAALLASALSFFYAADASAVSRHDRDNFFNPPPNGPSLKAMAFWGPGVRLQLEDHIPPEQDMSDLKLNLTGDVNYGYSEVSALAEVRVFFFTLGVAGGYRVDWHLLQFQPDATTGQDHGQPTLTRQARQEKDKDGQWRTETWGWGEGRFGMVLPMQNFFGVTTLAVRYEDRPNQSFDWNFTTVYDKGWIYNWESYLVYRNKHAGFVGPALRILDVPRTTGGVQERKAEVQYGILAGTQPRWSSASDLVLLRVFTTVGLNNDLYGIDANLFGLRYEVPFNVLIGYQTDLTF